MQLFGIIVGLSTLVIEAVLLWRAAQSRLLARFPLFYSYLVYVFVVTVVGLSVYWVRPSAHASVYWFCFVLSIIVEFAVLVEVSDHIFQPYPAIRDLGRSLTLLISLAFGAAYILPTLFRAHGMRMALLDFALRTSLTKAVILLVIFGAAHHFDLRMGRNVAGLLLGFAIYLGVNVANFACVERFGNVYAGVLWFMSPAAYTLCLLVWTGALWEFAPMPRKASLAPATGEDSEELAVELARFNNTLSRFLNR